MRGIHLVYKGEPYSLPRFQGSPTYSLPEHCLNHHMKVHFGISFHTRETEWFPSLMAIFANGQKLKLSYPFLLLKHTGNRNETFSHLGVKHHEPKIILVKVLDFSFSEKYCRHFDFIGTRVLIWSLATEFKYVYSK